MLTLENCKCAHFTWKLLSQLDLDLVPPVLVGTLGSSLTPERTIHRTCVQPFPM